jgi:hypothetical protein
MEQDKDEKKEYICEKCNFKCKFISEYERHTKTGKHINGMVIRKKYERKKGKKEKIVYVCEKCNFSSTHLYNYKSHMLNNHLTEEEKKKEFKYYCNHCKIGMYAETTYNCHLKSKKHLIRCI